MKTMKRVGRAAMALGLTLGLVAGSAEIAEATAVPRVVHADGVWTYVDGHTENHGSDLGVISRPVDGAITLLRADGATVSDALPSDVCVRISGMPATVADLHFGMRALVISDGSGIRVVRAGFPLVRLDQPGCGLFDDAVHGDVTFTFADGTTRSYSFNRRAIAAGGGEILMQNPAHPVRHPAISRFVVRHPVLAARRALVISRRVGAALLGKTLRMRLVF